MQKKQRGDTIVEVMVAFAVFTLVAVGAVTVMNRGVALAQRSLEITLVRQQIDGQAELLRFARDTESVAWSNIKARTATSGGDSCYLDNNLPGQAFYMNIRDDKTVEYRSDIASKPLTPASVESRVNFGMSPQAEGLWVMPVRVSQNAYDMYIRACWYSPGADQPVTLGTIVRLYEN